MENTLPLKVLLVAEASGGHLIPALQVAGALAVAGAQVQVCYAERSQTATLAAALAEGMPPGSVEVRSIPGGANHPLDRLRRGWTIVRLLHRRLSEFKPDVVVGFGGWVSAPAILEARWRGAACVLHEQNVVMGRANQWLARWVDRVAVSFPRTQLPRGVSAVLTGMPVRAAIGAASREEAAKRFGLHPSRPTVLVLGGSQGSRAVNRLLLDVAQQLTASERASWQFIHLTGQADGAWVQQAYAAAGLKNAWVQPYFSDMAYVYALADIVVARAGASTIAELARCGKPALLIPYPYAHAHQRENVRLVEAVGGGVWLDEATLTPQRLAQLLRTLVRDDRLRGIMGQQMRTLSTPAATEQLAGAICRLARKGHATPFS